MLLENGDKGDEEIVQHTSYKLVRTRGSRDRSRDSEVLVVRTRSVQRAKKVLKAKSPSQFHKIL